MLAYIKGILEMKLNAYIVIDVGGLGYKVFMSGSAIDEVGEIGKEVKVYTYYRVREDDISIFGFITNEELRMFELLLSVSGIGAKTALAMLSEILPSEFALAVISNDVSKLVKIPGIGAKSAQRIILELKDKLKKEETMYQSTEESMKVAMQKDNHIEEAKAALQVLGYQKKEIEKAFEKIEPKDSTVEDMIKQGLSILGR